MFEALLHIDGRAHNPARSRIISNRVASVAGCCPRLAKKKNMMGQHRSVKANKKNDLHFVFF